MHPRIAATAYIDPTAHILGDVVIGEHSSVWVNAVLRGDMHSIRVGNHTNIQDNCILHVEEGLYGVTLGDEITVGHGVILHGCQIESRCLIAMGSIVLNDVHIGTGSIIAAGTVVAEHSRIPPNSMVMGIPGKVRRKTTEADVERITRGVDAYFRWKERYLKEFRGGEPARGRSPR